jgi:hypothetical protein
MELRWACHGHGSDNMTFEITLQRSVVMASAERQIPAYPRGAPSTA